MDWLLNNFQILIFLALLVGPFVLKVLKQQQEKSKTERHPHEHGTPASAPARHPEDLEEAQRTRRIQEEIRRKILERMGGGQPTTTPMPRVEAQTSMPRTHPVREAAPPPLPFAPPATAQYREPDVDIMERQHQLAEQMRALEAQQQSHEHAYQHQSDAIAASAITASGKSPEFNIRTELRGRAALRKAFILREVLGPPAGMKP